MILFHTVRYMNFISTGNFFTEIPLNKHASTLVIGINGSGKSTLLDAICFALFAKPFRNINKPQLVNSINKKGCLVELEFSIGSSKYIIKRGIKPAIFQVIKNNTLLNQTAASVDYQDILEKQILKLNFKSFRQIVILGSASFVPFMALATGQRREIIEDLLDLQIFTTMNVLLKARIADNTKLTGEINLSITTLKEQIMMYNHHMVQVQQDKEGAIKYKETLITETQDNINQLQEKINADEDTLNKIDSLYVDEDFMKQLQMKMKLKNKVESSIDHLKDEIALFEEHTDCPTCKQNISEDFRLTQVTDRKKQIDKITVGIKKLDKEITKLQAKCDEQFEQKKEIGECHGRITHNRSIQDLQSQQIDRIKQEIVNLNTATYEYNGIRIEELNKELQQAEANLEAAIEDKTTYNAAATILKDSGIKAKIIKQYVPVINQLVNKYLSALDFFVEFEFNEAFEESIKSRFRDDFSYESFSEGEKKRINLAIIFTWRAIAKLRNSANTNLFILDEVFDSSLDISGMEDVLRLLLSLSAENTFIISHNPATAGDKFDNVIKFEKRNNFSKVMANA